MSDTHAHREKTETLIERRRAQGDCDRAQCAQREDRNTDKKEKCTG